MANDEELDAKRQRSPNYPLIGFKSALELATRLYEQEKRHPTTRALAAKYMGYNSINGRSKGVLSAVRKFGLIEPAGDDLVRVSDDAQALLVLPPDDPQRAELVQKLALRPEIYRELLNEFPGDLPSDANLRSHLILKRKFTEDAADLFLAAFRESVAEVPKAGATPVRQEEPKPESSSILDNFMTAAFRPTVQPKGDDPPPRAVDVQVINLGDGVKAELRILGKTEPKHIRKLIKFLQLSLEEEVDPLS